MCNPVVTIQGLYYDSAEEMSSAVDARRDVQPERLNKLRKETKRDSSLRDPAHKKRAQEKAGSLRSE
jgi:hypothetical protein